SPRRQPGRRHLPAAPLGFTARIDVAVSKAVLAAATPTGTSVVAPIRDDVRHRWLQLRGIDVQHRPPLQRIDDLAALPGMRTGCTLRAAIEEANALAGAQTISIDGRIGTYALTKGELVIT